MTEEDQIGPPFRAVAHDGSLLYRRFRVHRALGTPGTIAFSVRALDELTNEEVVCKIPCRPDQSLYKSLLDQYRFMRELKSPRMPAMLGYFRHEDLAGGEPFPFLVMELVPGEQAERWRHGRPAREKLRMFLDVVDTIADLNDRGIEHGDVHLGNILVDGKGRAVVIDPDSQCLGSVLAGAVKADGSKTDLTCLKHCLEVLVEDENANLAAGLLERLGPGDVSVPTARELAVILRNILASKLLPGQSSEALDDCASRYKNESSANLALYRRNRELRDLEFRRIRDLLKPMAEKFGFKVDTNLDGGVPGRIPVLNSSLVKTEEQSEATPYGRFESRELSCSTLDGDKLYLGFDAAPAFRRPWPEVSGLLSKGILSVVFHGAERAILLRPLELWFVQGQTILGSREPDRFAYLEAGDFERALRVLAGDVYPGVPGPLVIPRKANPLDDLPKVTAQYQALQKRGIPFARPGHEEEDKGMQSLGMALLLLVLELPPGTGRPNNLGGVRFHDLMAVPIQKRHQLVVDEVAKVTAFLGSAVGLVRRFDVRSNDSRGEVLIFEIDAKMDCGFVHATIRSDNSSQPRKIQVQAIEIRPPENALASRVAQLAVPKSLRERLSSK